MELNHTNCLFCGQRSTFSTYNCTTTTTPAQTNVKDANSVWTKWKFNCGKTIASLLPVPQTTAFTNLFIQGSYCNPCAELVWDANFALKQIKALQNRVDSIQKKIEENLNQHFKLLGNEIRKTTSKGSSDSKLKVKYRIVKKIVEEIRQPKVLKCNPIIDNHTNLIKKEPILAQSQDETPVQRQAAKNCKEVLKNISKSQPDDDGEVGVSADDKFNSGDNDYNDGDEEYVPEDNDDPQDLKPQVVKIRWDRRRKYGIHAGPKNIQKYPCTECDQVLTSINGLTLHCKQLHKGTKYTCTICTRYFQSQFGLETHRKNEHSNYSFYCPTCTKGCSSKEELSEHVALHNSTATPYSCVVCQSVYASLQDLHKHVKDHDNPFKCNVCTKCFATDEALQKHVKYHEKNFSCETCGLFFYSLSNLKFHQVTIHVREKKYTCEICTASFARVNGLRRHARTHTGERPYSCSVCSKSFTYRWALKGHEEIHSGIKPYICQICGKAFGAHQNLRQHVLIHNDVKPKKKRRPGYKRPNPNLVAVRTEEEKQKQVDIFNTHVVQEEIELM